jgi:hypothetical protein
VPPQPEPAPRPARSAATLPAAKPKPQSQASGKPEARPAQPKAKPRGKPPSPAFPVPPEAATRTQPTATPPAGSARQIPQAKPALRHEPRVRHTIAPQPARPAQPKTEPSSAPSEAEPRPTAPPAKTPAFGSKAHARTTPQPHPANCEARSKDSKRGKGMPVIPPTSKHHTDWPLTTTKNTYMRKMGFRPPSIVSEKERRQRDNKIRPPAPKPAHQEPQCPSRNWSIS